jgi:hypothetical protein
MGACLLCCSALCCAVVDRTLGRRFLTKINANIGNSAVSSSIEEVRGFFELVFVSTESDRAAIRMQARIQDVEVNAGFSACQAASTECNLGVRSSVCREGWDSEGCSGATK